MVNFEEGMLQHERFQNPSVEHVFLKTKVFLLFYLMHKFPRNVGQPGELPLPTYSQHLGYENHL